MKRTGTSSTPCVYVVQVNKTLIALNPQLAMLPAIHLETQIELYHVPVTFVNVSND